LRPYAVPIGALDLDPDNARTHPKKQLAQVRKHLERVGQLEPVLYQRKGKRGIVRVGNARLVAAKELGWKYIAAIDPKLTDDQWAYHSLLDNRAAEMGGWDADRYAELVQSVIGDIENPKVDPADLNISEAELRDAMGITKKKPKASARHVVMTCPKCGKQFKLKGDE